MRLAQAKSPDRRKHQTGGAEVPYYIFTGDNIFVGFFLLSPIKEPGVEIPCPTYTSFHRIANIANFANLIKIYWLHKGEFRATFLSMDNKFMHFR